MNSEDYFSAIPNELVRHISFFLDLKSRANLSRTSQFFNRSLRDDFIRTKLLQHVLRGEEAEALVMIEKMPELLLQKGHVVDRQTNLVVTPFQAALLKQDRWLWKKMLPFLNKFKEGDFNPVRKQFYDLFPHGLPELQPYNFDQLVQAITQSPDEDIKAALEQDINSEIYQVIQSFRKDFTAISMRERFFNPQHFIKAFEIHANTTWNAKRRRLFWCQVIGYIQRLFPVCLAQVFCQGLGPIVSKGEPLIRKLDINLVNMEISEKFPIKFYGPGLGSEYAAYVGVEGVEGVEGGEGDIASQSGQMWRKLPYRFALDLLSLHVAQMKEAFLDLCIDDSSPDNVSVMTM